MRGHDGGVSGFNASVAITNSENVQADNLRVAGVRLAPHNDPGEIGVPVTGPPPETVRGLLA